MFSSLAVLGGKLTRMSAEAAAQTPRRVILSRTSELRDYTRLASFVAAERAVARAGDAVTDMAYLIARDAAPAQVRRERMGAPDVFVLVAGFCYRSSSVGCELPGLNRWRDTP